MRSPRTVGVPLFYRLDGASGADHVLLKVETETSERVKLMHFTLGGKV
jgi:hypothetical protein